MSNNRKNLRSIIEIESGRCRDNVDGCDLVENHITANLVPRDWVSFEIKINQGDNLKRVIKKEGFGHESKERRRRKKKNREQS